MVQRSRNRRVYDRGWARLDGFAGIARGFRIARELVANYWENLYPSRTKTAWRRGVFR